MKATRRVTATAASYAGPQIIKDLHVNISSIISLRSVVGFFLTFAVIGIGWWADRHKRVPLLATGKVDYPAVLALAEKREAASAH